jgi:homocysteine S-methyltransferase
MASTDAGGRHDVSRLNQWHAWASSKRGQILLDGGLATTLEAEGFKLGDTLWSARVLASDPEAVRRVSVQFLEAGADLIATCTYQASKEGFDAELGIGPAAADDLMRGSVGIARDAADFFWENLSPEERTTRALKPLVVLSLGSYGAFRADGSEYHGRYDVPNSTVMQFHKERLKSLLRGSFGCSNKPSTVELPDLVAFETIPTLAEAKIIVSLMQELAFSDPVPFWLSFQCSSDNALPSGEHLERAVSELLDSNAGNQYLIAIGVNCVPPKYTKTLVHHIRTAIEKHMAAMHACREPWTVRVVAYPNSGEIWLRGDGWHWSGQALSTEAWAQILINSGADIIGGCCRCGPGYVRALKCLQRNGVE